MDVLCSLVQLLPLEGEDSWGMEEGSLGAILERLMAQAAFRPVSAAKWPSSAWVYILERIGALEWCSLDVSTKLPQPWATQAITCLGSARLRHG